MYVCGEYLRWHIPKGREFCNMLILSFSMLSTFIASEAFSIGSNAPLLSAFSPNPNIVGCLANRCILKCLLFFL